MMVRNPIGVSRIRTGVWGYLILEVMLRSPQTPILIIEEIPPNPILIMKAPILSGFKGPGLSGLGCLELGV